MEIKKALENLCSFYLNGLFCQSTKDAIRGSDEKKKED